jgi:putative membrane protein
MMGWHGGMGGWGALVMAVLWVLFWAAVIVGVVLLARGTAATTRPPAPADVLADRFARGEINEEEYQSRLAVLRRA